MGDVVTRLVRVPKLTTQYGPAPSGKVTAAPLPGVHLERERVSPDLVRDPDTLSRLLDRIQDHIDSALQRTSPLDGGVILSSEDGTTTGLSFSAGVPRTLTHKLGHKPQFVVVLSAWNGYPQFQRIDQSASDDAVSIKLQFQNTCKVVLWMGP